MKKYTQIFKINLISSLQYKAHGLIYTIFDLIPPLISMVYWNKAFETQAIISGYTQIELVTYLLLTGIIRTLIISYPEHDMYRIINQGMLNNYLLKPISFVSHMFLGEISFKFNRAIFTIPSYFVFGAIALKLTGQLPQLKISPTILTLLALSFIIAFLLKFLIGLVAVWTTEISWLISFNDLIGLLLSGTLLPLDFFPHWFQTMSAYLPFQYLTYIPVLALQGKLESATIYQHLFNQLVWITILYIIYKYIWSKALKNYTAYGG